MSLNPVKPNVHFNVNHNIFKNLLLLGAGFFEYG